MAATAVAMTAAPAAAHAAITISGPATPVTESGPGQTATMRFTVQRSSVLIGPSVTVRFRVVGGTATPASDFIDPGARTVTLPPDVFGTAVDVDVAVVGDGSDEVDETVAVLIDQASGDVITGGGTASGTIADDDAPPTVALADGSGQEGTTTPGSVPLALTVSEPSGKAISVPYTLAAGTAGADDVDLAGGTLELPAGATGATLDVPTRPDAVDEDDETFTATLGTPTNATVGADGTATGTVVDDDTALVAIGDVSAAEGTGPGPTPVAVPVTLSTPRDRAVTVRARSVAGGTAASPADHAALDEVVTFPAGTTSRSATLAVVGDALDEPDETVAFALSDATEVAVDRATATATIVDDDDAPVASVADGSGTEGTASAGTVDLGVTLSAPSGRTVTVPYVVTAGTAAASDVVLGAGSVELDPGATAGTATVATIPDAVDETDETFTVTLGTPTGAGVADGTATGTVLDDDTARLSIADATVPEGTRATATVATARLTLSTPADRAATVRVRSTDGTATSPADHAAVDVVVPIPAGATAADVPLAVTADAVDELDETFTLALSAPTVAELDDAAATVAITDDDTARATIADVSVLEGTDATATAATATVTLSTAADRPASVRVRSTDGTATSPADHAAVDEVVAFAPGVTTAQVPLAIVADAVDEPDERFTLTLSEPVVAGFGDATATVTIRDDDVPPRPVDPDPVDPGPVDPGPVDPGPVDPGPAAPTPPTPAAAPAVPSTPVPPPAPVVAADVEDRTKPAIRVTALTRLRPDRLRIRVSCPAAERRCRGAVTVFTVPDRRASRALLRRELRVGRVEFTVDGGTDRVVSTRMTARTRTLLRSVGRLRIRAFAVARDAAGNVGTARRTVTIRR